MGCFSYICPICKNPIYSDKYENCIGEKVHLGLLVDGKIVEHMYGKYDSYGKVHIGKNSFHKINDVDVEQPTLDCNRNEGTHDWRSHKWNKIIDLHFDLNKNNGICAIHDKCWEKAGKKFPTIRSDDDPDQGWRDYENPEEDEC